VVFLEGTHHFLVLDLSAQGIDARMIPLEAGRPADAFTVRTAAAVSRGARSPSDP
jgi:MFS superfamily sulfate permease-like transporter